MRRYITRDACKTLAHGLITSLLVYGNILPKIGLSSKLMMLLQRVQNSATRLITCTSKRDHSTPVLNYLHRLPVIYKPHYNAFDGTVPIIWRSLRSVSEALLSETKNTWDDMFQKGWRDPVE